MITRKEALQTIHDCRITSLGELAHGYTVYQATANILINQLFDQQDQLQQHIKELEYEKQLQYDTDQMCQKITNEKIKYLDSQLSSNTLQLNCEYKEDNDIYMGTVYNFDCGYSYVTIEGDLKENGINFCPSCGGKITQKDTK